MLSWLWETFFGEEAEEHNDTVSISVADLTSIAQDMRALQNTVDSTKDALASTEKNARLFYQSIEDLLMETYDAVGNDAEVSLDSAQLREMRAELEAQRSTVSTAMMKQKEAIEIRLFRAQMQLRTLEKQKKGIQESARQLDDASNQPSHVIFPVPVATDFFSSGADLN